MSTPIEIVREYRLWQRRPVMVCGYTWNEPPHTREEYDAALASVLRDAERLKALEAAFERHCNDGAVTVMRWKGQRIWHYTKEPDIDGSTLAELADRLKASK